MASTSLTPSDRGEEERQAPETEEARDAEEGQKEDRRDPTTRNAYNCLATNHAQESKPQERHTAQAEEGDWKAEHDAVLTANAHNEDHAQGDNQQHNAPQDPISTSAVTAINAHPEGQQGCEGQRGR